MCFMAGTEGGGSFGSGTPFWHPQQFIVKIALKLHHFEQKFQKLSKVGC